MLLPSRTPRHSHSSPQTRIDPSHKSKQGHTLHKTLCTHGSLGTVISSITIITTIC